jgi:hypothetical protein
MKYSGRLAKPVRRKRYQLRLAAALRNDEALLHASVNEAFEKLPDLFATHEIEQGDWVGLAIKLAFAHVPGFKIVDPPGRPTEWSGFEKAELRYDADALIASRKTLSVTAALQAVKKHERWAAKAAGMKPAALAKHYYAADVSLLPLIEKSRAYDEAVKRGETIGADD